MAKKRIQITISESDLKHCKQQSFKKLKDTNVSGYIAVLIQKDKGNEKFKPHSFCETPEESCSMNYCNENGCMNRKRELTELTEQIKNQIK